VPSIRSDNKTHEASCAVAESTHQAAIAAANGNAASLRTAEQVYYRAIISSCKTNGLPFVHFSEALHNWLGTDGT
jgi:hypothetical protein